MSDVSFNQHFNPVLLPGETALLRGSQFPSEGQPVKCIAFGALPEYQKDFGSLSAATWSNNNEDSNLEMPTHELAQLRMRILDDFKLQLKHPAAVQQWRTNKVNFYLRKYPTEAGEDFLKEYMFRASEFFIYYNITPRFDLYSEFALTEARVLFSGWRFRLEDISKEELTSKQELWINNWPSGK